MSDEDDVTGEGEGTNLVNDLRKQLRAAQRRIGELESTAKTTVFSSVFEEFGLDPDKGPGRLAASAYSGDLTADAVRDWLTEEGFEPAAAGTDAEVAPAGVRARVEQQGRIAAIREQSEASSGQKVPHDQWMSMFSGTPDQRAEAARLHAEGLVDMPHAS